MSLLLGYKKIINDYAKLIPPLVVSIAIGFAGIAMTDTIMVGRLGSQYLAAASISNSLCTILFIFSIGIGVALTPIFSSMYSSGDTLKNTKILKHGLLLNFILGICLYAILYLLSNNLYLLKQPEEVSKLAKDYIKIISLSIIPRAVKDILNRYLEGVDLAKISMIGSIITFLNNILFNYILIFGKLGFPELKLVGAGIATLLARILDVFFLYLYFYFYIKKKKLIKDFFKTKIQISEIVYLFKICFPSAMQLTFEIGFFAFENIFIGWLGTKFQAAHAIAGNIARISFVIPLSIAIASSILVGKYTAKKSFDNIKKIGILSYSMVIGFYILNTIILLLFFENILHLYKAEMVVKKIFISFLVPFIFFQIFDGINVVGVNLLRGLHDTFIPVIFTSGAQWIFGIPLSYAAFKFFHTINSIWWVSAFAFILSALLLFFRFQFKIRTFLYKKHII